MSELNLARPMVEDVIAGLETTSARIRALALARYERAEIARILSIKYQHVRKVLVDADAKNDPKARQGTLHRTSRPLAPSLEASPAVLLRAGFQVIGEWMPTAHGTFHLSERAPRDPGIYAFVVDGVVRYIGLTQTGLQTRMGHYRRGHRGHRTSSRVKALILACLAEGKPVQVLAATPEPLDWRGLPVSTAAGLEAALIRAMRPEWNMLGARSDLHAKSSAALSPVAAATQHGV
jgi:hypothetical protein